MPEGVVLAVEGQAGLVATMLTVIAEHLPRTLIDVKWEIVGKTRTVYHTLHSAIGRDGACLIKLYISGVLLIITTIDAVPDDSVLCRCGHLDITIGKALTTDGLTDRHIDTGSLSSLDASLQRNDEEAERGVG